MAEKTKRIVRYKSLYHYTSFNTFIKIWLSQQLKFADISGVNDIFEVDISTSIINPLQAPLVHAFNNIRLSYKQISFTMDYNSQQKGCMSPMMWGIYADKRNGVCIELDYDKIQFPPHTLKGIVNYVPILKKFHIINPTIKTQKELHQYIKKNKRELMFTKHKSWSGENEYRVLNNSFEYLNISGAIKAIYLTSYKSDECLFVEKMVNGMVPVKFLRYVASKDNVAKPVLSETKSYRESVLKAKENPNNVLNKIDTQSFEFYEKYKNDNDTCLLKQEYLL